MVHPAGRYGPLSPAPPFTCALRETDVITLTTSQRKAVIWGLNSRGSSWRAQICVHSHLTAVCAPVDHSRPGSHCQISADVSQYKQRTGAEACLAHRNCAYETDAKARDVVAHSIQTGDGSHAAQWKGMSPPLLRFLWLRLSVHFCFCELGLFSD